MDVERNRRQMLLSWTFVGALVTLSATLGILQYRWIGEVSRAERERLRETVLANLRRLSQDFNAELTVACTRLLPELPKEGDKPPDAEFATRYSQWRETSRNNRLFRTVALAIPQADSLSLNTFDPEKGVFVPAEWPASWQRLRDRLQARLQGDRGPGRHFPGPTSEDTPALIELPYFSRVDQGPQAWHEVEWLVLELNLDYVRESMIPELLHRHLGGGGDSDFDAEVVMRDNPGKVIFASDPSRATHLEKTADASVALFDVRPDVVFRRAAGNRGQSGAGPGDFFGNRRGHRPPPPDGMMFDHGRWQLFVRHRSGSLEAVVAKARTRNLFVSTGILLLLIGAAAALVRFTRRAQKLAELQMEFVAGVSHELRTPLSVMRTAGHNLQGRVSTDPSRVQRYGALIQEESEKLTAIVEQILRFANANAGRVIGGTEEVFAGHIVDEAVEASRRSIEEAHCTIDKKVSPDVPRILADPTTLKHAIQNLVINAAKYGRHGDFIRVSAAAAPDDPSMVEIRVSDHGEGIPADEIAHIFEPFYRGKKAIEEQIHGTGLGLSLTKRIIEAHGGTIQVESERGQGSTFTVRIPALAIPEQHELANSIDRG